MAILIKTAPQQAVTTLMVGARGISSSSVQTGECAFVWFSETQNGAGLIALATISGIEEVLPGQFSISLGNVREITQPLGNAQIGPFRDSRDERPESTLAKKIYRYAHNRIVRLTDEETSFLTSRAA